MSTAAVQTGAASPYSDHLVSFGRACLQDATRGAPVPNPSQFNYGRPPSPAYVASTSPNYVAMSQAMPQPNSRIVYQSPLSSPFGPPGNSSAAGLGPVLFRASLSPVPVIYSGSLRYNGARLSPSPLGQNAIPVHTVCSISPVHTANFTGDQYRNSGRQGADSSVERDRPQETVDVQNRDRKQEMDDDIRREVQRHENSRDVGSRNRKTPLPPHFKKQSSRDSSEGVFLLEGDHDTQSDEEEPKNPPLSPGASRKTPTSLQAQRSNFNMPSEPWLDEPMGQFSSSCMEPLTPSQDLSQRAQYDRHRHNRERQRVGSDAGPYRGSPRGPDPTMFHSPRDHPHHAPVPRAGYDLGPPAFESHSFPPPDMFSPAHHFDERPPQGWERRGIFVTDPYETNNHRRYKTRQTRRAGKKVQKAKQKAIEEHKNRRAKKKDPENSQTQNYRQKQNLCDQVEKELEAIEGWNSVKSKTSYRGADVLFLQIKVPAALKQIVKMMEEIMERKDENGNRQLQNLHMNVQLKKKKLKKGFLLYLKFETEEQVEAIIKEVWPNYTSIPRCEKAVFKKNTSKPNQQGIRQKSEEGDAQIGGCIREAAAAAAPVASKLRDLLPGNLPP